MITKISHLRHISMLVLSTSLFGLSHAQPVAWDEMNNSIQEILQRNHIVGAGLAILSPGSTLEAYFGLADQESGQSVDEETLFHWASITKTFTGICAMQAVQEGLLDLDKPITFYLPETRVVHNPFGSMDDVTVRHLMTHSSGLRGSTWPWGGDQSWHPFEPTDWSQLVAMMPYTELQFSPGSQYSYSNPGITFLGKILENLYDEDIEVIVRKRIFMPLEMNKAYFDSTPPYLQNHRSNSYAVEPDGRLVTHGKEFDTGITKGNGGLNASFQDMIKYVQFLQNVAGGGESPLLSPESWQTMTLPVLPTGEEKDSIGTIFFVLDRNLADKNQRFIGHTGSQQGFRAFLYLYPEFGKAVLFNMNTEIKGRNNGDLSREVLYQIRELVFDYLVRN